MFLLRRILRQWNGQATLVVRHARGRSPQGQVVCEHRLRQNCGFTRTAAYRRCGDFRHTRAKGVLE